MVFFKFALMYVQKVSQRVWLLHTLMNVQKAEKRPQVYVYIKGTALSVLSIM